MDSKRRAFPQTKLIQNNHLSCVEKNNLNYRLSLLYNRDFVSFKSSKSWLKTDISYSYNPKIDICRERSTRRHLSFTTCSSVTVILFPSLPPPPPHSIPAIPSPAQRGSPPDIPHAFTANAMHIVRRQQRHHHFASRDVLFRQPTTPNFL